jgi:pantoate--beta-alanine ligase
MQIISSITEARAACRSVTRGVTSTGQALTLGLVPTMGALHEGHISLVREARRTCDRVAVTIFVNPLQFAPNEDLTKYPRTFERDCEVLEREQVDLLFAPRADELTPASVQTFVDVPLLGGRLDGASRPGHFRGVATIADPNTLEPVLDISDGALIAVAAWCGTTRLIDNVLVSAPAKESV